tara:strand:+ start:1056 stop:1448 length:393 start_codon:yes stop_codon:yes gene_type:complete
MNKFLAHHINPNAGAGVNNPFAEPSMEQIVDMIMSGEMPKEKLGENADQIIREVNERRSQTEINPTNFKMPGEFPGTLEEFNQKYGENNKMDNRPTYMEIPVIPFDPNKKENSKEDDLSFLKAFTKSRMG